jgi:tRNA (guanine-N7-)-methyltransferase
VRHDAVEVLREMLAPASLAGVHVFFPDPWHKKRHHKRRLIQPPLVALLASRLAARWLAALRHRLGSPTRSRCSRCCRPSRCCVNTAEATPPRPDYRPLTKFEPAA